VTSFATGKEPSAPIDRRLDGGPQKKKKNNTFCLLATPTELPRPPDSVNKM
jgi:hypothetical protein